MVFLLFVKPRYSFLFFHHSSLSHASHSRPVIGVSTLPTPHPTIIAGVPRDDLEIKFIFVTGSTRLRKADLNFSSPLPFFRSRLRLFWFLEVIFFILLKVSPSRVPSLDTTSYASFARTDAPPSP